MLNGTRLREIRKSQGLTQTELGELIGVGKSAICCYEKEIRNPTIETIIDLMHIFGVSADYLLGTDVLIANKDLKNSDNYVSMTKEEIKFIMELRKNKLVYEILLENPKRGADLIKKEIG